MRLTCDGVKGRDSQQYDDGHINIQSHSNLDKYGSRKYICLWCRGRIGPFSQSAREVCENPLQSGSSASRGLSIHPTRKGCAAGASGWA